MNSPIAIIAGNGDLPIELATRLSSMGNPVFICAIEGEADTAVKAFPHAYFRFGQVGKLFKTLTSEGCKQVVLAGGIVGRPDIIMSGLDIGAVLTLPKILSAILGGDNEILNSVVSVFESKGFEVVGAGELLPELIVTSGDNAKTKAKSGDLKVIVEGVSVIRSLAPHDVGQGCVVVGKRAVAIEGAEGTDAMLERVLQLRQNGRLPEKRNGVLVKAIKTGQNDKVDLPTIGPKTVELAIDANLKGIAVEAHKTLIVSREDVLKLADAGNLFIHGFEG